MGFTGATGTALNGRPSSGNGGVTVTFQNLQLIRDIMAEIEDGLRKEANAELRAASKKIAKDIVIPQLKRAARSSPMKIAKAFADTAVARSDRVVMVQVGGRQPAISGFTRGVSKKKAEAGGKKTRSGRLATSQNYAASMAWGSNYGPYPGADVNNYGQPRRDPGGYWINQGIDSSIPAAVKEYEKALNKIIDKYSRYR
jgi:hypothetical protein